jgi:hypothetical protein
MTNDAISLDISPVSSADQLRLRAEGRKVFLLLGSTPPQFYADVPVSARGPAFKRRSPIGREELMQLTPTARTFDTKRLHGRIGAAAEYVLKLLADDAAPVTRGELETVLAAELAARESAYLADGPRAAQVDVSQLIHRLALLEVVPKS